MRAPRYVGLLATAILLSVLAGAPALGETARFPLASGDTAFWDGPSVARGQGTQWNYEIEVLEPAYSLRIGIDHPEVADVYDVDVFRPNGAPAGSFSPGTGLYSAERIFVSPAVGVWRVRVTADDVTDSAFRMRAALEAEPPPLGVASGPVLPNLQVLPPHDPSFLMPLTNGATGGAPQGIDLLGAESCHPEERIEELALRCLRFSFGIRNTGRGPMQLHFNGSAPGDQMLYQRVTNVDGTTFDRVAGIARYHKTHAHYHHHDAVVLRLFRVTDREKGTLEPAGVEHRKGFAHRDELLREWRNFYPIWERFGFGLAAGWSDIYEWDRPGNYIDFGLNGDGYYVVRMAADPGDGVLESNEVDNAGYSYLRVMGTTVQEIEAGRGSDPWDRCKIVMPFGGYPEPPETSRPDDCPPDTT